MNAALAAVRRINRTVRPEEDVRLRRLVLASVLLAVAAVLLTGSAPPADGIVALVLLPLGAWWSHRRRRADNTLLKAALTLGAALALGRFFGDLGAAGSVDAARRPLTQLFLAVQVLHGADLPQRRDLGFTLASSLALVALAGAGLQEAAFAPVLLAYGGVAGLALVRLQRSSATEAADEAAAAGGLRAPSPPDPPAAPPPARLRAWLRAAAPVLLATALVFSLLPTTSRSRLTGLPFAGVPGPPLPAAGVTNPGLPYAERDADGAPVPEGEYFGFAETVDLSTAPRLSDEPVLRLRTDRPRLLRGVVLDRYDGRGWARTSPDPGPLRGLPVNLAPPARPLAELAEHVTTVEVLRELPNLVFAPAEPAAVWLAAGAVSAWDDGTVTTPATLGEGTVYSVVSLLDVAGPERLRVPGPGAYATGPPGGADRWLQLPAGLPPRVRDLAADLTRDRPTPYAKAEAVEDWLAANTEYSLHVDPAPEGADVIDHFLFTSRRGWCEPIASSAVVLLRAAGVPARYATGFQPGARNPLTGWWTVRGSDAHAWAEVWVPGHGWTPVDATGAVPSALDPEARAPSIPLVGLLQWAGERLRELVPAGLRTALLGPPGRAAAVSVLVFAAVLLASLTWLRHLRRRAPSPSPFLRLAARAAAAGVPAPSWQTPREYAAALARARPDLPSPALAALLADEEHRRYDPGGLAPPGDPERALAELTTALAARPGWSARPRA